MTWLESLNQNALKGASVVTKGFQSAAVIPAHHRLFNASLMGIGWLGGNWLREIVFAQKHDGTEILREDVPAPLRFLHGLVLLNQYADDAHNHWKKMVYQLMPAVGGAFGAYYGSQLAFERPPHLEGLYRENQRKMRDGEKMTLFDADNAASYAVSKPLRVLAGVFSIFSAASGLTALYGLFLGSAFATSSNRTVFPTIVKDVWGPARAAPVYVASSMKYARAAAKGDGAIDPEWAAMFARNVIKPLFPKHSEEEIRAKLQGMIQKAYDDVVKTKTAIPDIEKGVNAEVKELFDATKFPQTLVKLGIPAEEIRNAKIGNSVPWARWPVEKVQVAFEKMTGHKGQIRRFQDRMAESLPADLRGK